MFIRVAINYFLSFLHTSCLKLRNDITIGSGSLVFFRTRFNNFSGNTIQIGNNCKIGCSRHGYHAGMPFYTTLLNDGENSRIEIGDNCRLNGVYIHAQKSIKIGDNCVMASGISIIDSNGHQLNSFDRTVGRDTPKRIVIGNNVWICLNSIILKDTIIGNNCVVAAGSVVKGVFPDNSLIQGNPATIVSTFQCE